MSGQTKETVKVIVKFKLLTTSSHLVELTLPKGYKVDELVKSVKEYILPSPSISEMTFEEESK